MCCLAVMITRTHQLFTTGVTVNFHSLQGSAMWGEETSWDFVSSNMAPLCLDTSPHSGGQLTSAADSQAVISNFIHEVAKTVAEISKNEVAITNAELFEVGIKCWFSHFYSCSSALQLTYPPTAT